MDDLKKLFEPKSIALAGVSKDPRKISHWLIRNLVEGGFKKAIYPISPKGGEILGHKVYPSFKTLPEPVDLVLVSVASTLVKGVIEDASENKASIAVILTSGFGEISDEGGKILEKEILRIAEKSTMRIMGPNCLGIYNAHWCLNGTYLVTPPLMKGSIAVVSQSGAYGGIIVNEINSRGVGLGKLASIGNQIDILHQEVIEYLSHDEDTDVIGLFVEGVKDGPDFLSVIKKVSKIKPIVIFKGGRTIAGQRAAASHTGSLAGDFAVAEAAFRQAGALFAHTTEEFFDYLFGLAYNRHRLPKDEKVAIITISGGPCVTASDYCEEIGLVVPELSDATKGKVRKYIPFFAAASNPIDMTVATLPENFSPCVDAVLADPDISGAISVNWGFDVKEFAQAYVDAAEKHQKPILAFANENPIVQEIFRQNCIVNFPAPERAVRSYWGLVQYKRIKDKKELEKRFIRLPSKKVEEIFKSNKTTLNEYMSKEVLREYGIPTCRETIAKDLKDLPEKAKEIGFPVVLKVLSDEILHKTEQGGILLNIQEESKLLNAAKEMKEKFSEKISFLVQEWVPSGIEIIIGMKRNDTFGPVVAFGLGGIFTEIMRDVSLRVCPLSYGDVLEMIHGIKGYPILRGYRGAPPVDEDALAEVILRVGELVLQNDRIMEMDINPLIVNRSVIKAVDALILLGD